VPLRRDLANHDGETARSLATWAGCNRGSILILTGPEARPARVVPDKNPG